MSIRRKLFLAWLAVALSALAPVFVYAQIQLGSHGEILDSCAKDEGDSDAQDHHSKSNGSTVGHCVYCPGFSAGVPLAQSALGSPQPVAVSSALVAASLFVPGGRPSVRIAPQRAPPSFS